MGRVARGCPYLEVTRVTPLSSGALIVEAWGEARKLVRLERTPAGWRARDLGTGRPEIRGAQASKPVDARVR